MKKVLLSIIAGAALFAAGYYTCYTTRPPAEAEEKKEGPVVAAATARAAAEAAAKEKAAAEAQPVRPFTPGRPFPKGGAKGWLLNLVSNLKETEEAKMPELLDTVQAVLTMDEECAKEMVEALIEVARALESGDPAMKALVEDNDVEPLLEGGLVLAMARIAQFNPDAVVALAQKHPDLYLLSDDAAMTMVFGRIASKDPQRAEQLAQSLPANSRSDALESVLKTMMTKDPQAALALVQRHPDDLSGQTSQVLLAWVKRDPLAAMNEAVKQDAESGVVRYVFSEWLEKDSDAAEAWAAKHEGPGKTGIQAAILDRQAREDPASVLTEFAALQKSAQRPEELASLAGTIAGKLAEDDLPAARNWVDSLPAGEQKESASLELAKQWINTDVEAASAFIKTMPPGETRDFAVVSLTEKIIRRDPASALEWARSLEEESMRRERTGAILQAWEEQDPEAAKAARAALPPDEDGPPPAPLLPTPSPLPPQC